MLIPELTGKQTDVLYLEPNKHNVVLGVAGSGKTIIAILRAKYLANLCESTNGRVLLTTYNTTLDRYFKIIENEKPENLDICIYHKFARGYLNSIGKMKSNCILANTYNMIEMAKTIISNLYENVLVLNRPTDIFVEEISWIEKMGITTLQEYINAERIGRGNTRIKREERKYFFEVYEKYLEIRKNTGYLYDWDDIARYVRDYLLEDENPRYYNHVVIDEGQDFSPVMIQSLANCIPEDGSLTLFGDVAQQIYGSRYSWRDAGIKLGRSGVYKFEQNYRNSQEIADFANDIRKMKYWQRNEDLLTPTNKTAAGPKPVLLEFSDEQAELDEIVDYLLTKTFTESVAILVRNRADVKKIKEYIRLNGVECEELSKEMKKNNNEVDIFVGTYHSSKGLEFDTVILPFLNDEQILPAEKLLIHGKEETYQDEIKLFYVAVTRAKRGLIMSYTKSLVQLFPVDSSNYVKGVI